MKNIVTWGPLSISLWAALMTLSTTFANEANDTEPSPATAPFQQALAVDAVGDEKSYWRLLSSALRMDPEFELARWYSGQVLFQGKWQPVEAVGQRVAIDPIWREYRYRKQEANKTVQAQTELAHWCRRENLDHEEHWHWQQVLELDPDNRDAREGLGLKKYRGGWYTQFQIDEYEQQTESSQRKTGNYEREFHRWINQGRRGSDTLQQKMLSRLESVEDPLAVDALGIVMNEVLSNHSSKHREYHQEVCLAIVRAFSNIPEHSATLSLLNIAVFTDHVELRKEAAFKLRSRDETSYMPLLMSELSAPIEASYQINVTPAGHVSVVQEFEEERPRKVERKTVAQDLSSHTIIYRQRFAEEQMRRTGSPFEFRANPAGDYRYARLLVQRNNARVKNDNAQRSDRNAKIIKVLEIVTEKRLGEHPSAWWTAWQQHNELEYYEKPIEEDYFLSDYRLYDNVRTASCFVAGTPVWTQSGPVPIERIRTGDFVLSQDPQTGRLDFRPVLDTTIRPPSDMRQLKLGRETITTTLGHRFWVAGEGWQMAKFLSAGDQLFGNRGSMELETVESAEQAEAYNLVVSDFHTYFVGKSRLLVHDNNCPQPVAMATPGVNVKAWRMATQQRDAD